jgi:hypothetical protein
MTSTYASATLARPAAALITVLVAALLGCSNSPPAFESPDIDADEAAAAALELYDKNGDSQLDEAELAACPGVLAVLSEYDTSGDQRINSDEMSARIAAWAESPPMMSLDCLVTLDGRPLAGATVAFDPEPYVADSLPAARGVTNLSGKAAIGIPADQLDPRHRGIVALNPGVYKIRVTHPDIAIPAKFNEQTTFGREISMQTRPVLEELKLSRN